MIFGYLIQRDKNSQQSANTDAVYAYFIEEGNQGGCYYQQVNNNKKPEHIVLKPDVKLPIKEGGHHHIKKHDKNKGDDPVSTLHHHH